MTPTKLILPVEFVYLKNYIDMWWYIGILVGVMLLAIIDCVIGLDKIFYKN